ncbi:MAG: pitrilysin family protein [Chloroflexota bacterium]
MSAADLSVLDTRPGAAEPRPYDFPDFTRTTLPNGLQVIACHLPGRPLLAAQLVIRGDAGGGATGEPAELGGVTVLTARAMTEGTAHRDAVDLIEASERLGAEIGADAGWDSVAVSLEVSRSRLLPALGLLAEVALEPSFPAEEVDRLRDERLNDLLQAKADPRRRVERVYPETIFAADAPYRRPLGGTDLTVPAIDREAVVGRHAALMRPDAATLIVGGDLDGVDVTGEAIAAFGGWSAPSGARPQPGPASRAIGRRRIVVVDRPGSPQTELRVGHLGLARSTPDFHALSVTNAIVGGLFNSRLNQLLREAKGYTYGISSSFDLRRNPGPFTVRCAVQTEVTVPAILDILGELARVREAEVEPAELKIARDYLVGVFPLRFETAAQVVSAITGMVVNGLPDDELDKYRPAIAAVTPAQILAAARAHIRPDEASIVMVGDAARFEDALRDAGLGEVEVVRETAPSGEEDAG